MSINNIQAANVLAKAGAGESASPENRQKLADLAAEFESMLLMQMVREMSESGKWSSLGEGGTETLGADTFDKTFQLSADGPQVQLRIGRAVRNAETASQVDDFRGDAEHVGGAAGLIQRASPNSSLSLGSPAIQRVAKHRMTKCRSTRPPWSRTTTSRWPASATGSTVMLVSSITSRISASASPSPASTTPPGRVQRPSAGPRARRATSTWPSRMMAALTAR